MDSPPELYNACIAFGSECAFIKKMGEMEEPIVRVQIVLTLWMKKEEMKQSRVDQSIL